MIHFFIQISVVAVSAECALSVANLFLGGWYMKVLYVLFSDRYTFFTHSFCPGLDYRCYLDPIIPNQSSQRLNPEEDQPKLAAAGERAPGHHGNRMEMNIVLF